MNTGSTTTSPMKRSETLGRSAPDDVDEPTRRLRGESGVAVVEFALILPVLIVFMFGIIDYGMLFKADNQTEHALMSAGRVVAQQSKARLADYEALRMLKASTSGMSNATVTKVVIYKATAADGKVPAACLNASVNGVCNYYNKTKFETFETSKSTAFAGTASCTGSSWDSAWCPTTRSAQTDRIGMYVEVEYDHLTGMLPGNFTIKKRTVYSVEPTQIKIGPES